HLPEFFKGMLGVNSYLAEDPFFCVAKGAGLILTHLDVYKRTLSSKR
ncbi:rod shape-determining protein, partial [Candidatus Wolfebacteria bacterium]|nr:rod shape-determining protein [Candidatus Wolfebacteria bacterium]